MHVMLKPVVMSERVTRAAAVSSRQEAGRPAGGRTDVVAETRELAHCRFATRVDADILWPQSTRFMLMGLSGEEGSTTVSAKVWVWTWRQHQG